MRKGFNILNDQEDSNGITTLTLIVNSSYAGVNNTMIQCRTLTHVHSQFATILTIAGKIIIVISVVYIMSVHAVRC